MDKPALELKALRAQIERMEGRPQRFSAAEEPREAPWMFGIPALDTALPDGQLSFGACHDFTPVNTTDLPHLTGFIVALLHKMPRNGPVVWCQTAFNAREYGRIYAPGLLGHALSPERLLFVRVPKERDMALVLDECIRVPHVAAVVAEGPAPDFTASRRLTLAAQESHVPCLILNTGDVSASAAMTRWRIAPASGPVDLTDPQGPSLPAWSLTLARARGANTTLNPTLKKPLEICWDGERHVFGVAGLLYRKPFKLQDGGGTLEKKKHSSFSTQEYLTL